MSKTTGWLRLSYVVGAVADAFFAIAMIHPPLLQASLGMPPGEVSVETRSALGMGAALMAGWTVLLVWAFFDPVRRKGILLITVFPVIAGLALTTLYGFATGYIPALGAISVWVFQTGLVALFLFSYFRAGSQASG